MRKSFSSNSMRPLPSLAPSGSRRTGLTLFEAIFGLLACVLMLVALQLFSLTTLVSIFRAAPVILILTVLWGLAYLRAPELTKNGTVLLIIGLLTLSFLPSRALHMRETARRHTVRNNLREIGQIMQALQDTGTPGNMEDRFREHESVEALPPDGSP